MQEKMVHYAHNYCLVALRHRFFSQEKVCIPARDQNQGGQNYGRKRNAHK